jgi:hypothetical protein
MKQLQDNNRLRSNTAVNGTDVEDHRPIIGITVQQGMQLVTSVRKKDIMRPYVNPEAPVKYVVILSLHIIPDLIFHF